MSALVGGETRHGDGAVPDRLKISKSDAAGSRRQRFAIDIRPCQPLEGVAEHVGSSTARMARHAATLSRIALFSIVMLVVQMPKATAQVR